MPKRLFKVLNRLSRKKKGREQCLPSENLHGSNAASFLGLPAEIRNQIYEDLAWNTGLTLAAIKDRKPPPPVGLLLACKQTYQEYRSVLLSHAEIHVSVSNYSFSNLVRVLEKMREDDVAALRLNSQLWILLHVSHVPSREDRTNLRGWCDYRDSENPRQYFGLGRKAGNDLTFEYDVRFLQHVRPPRPMLRYANGYQMKLDLLRSHLKMYRRLQSPDDEVYSCTHGEMARLRQNIGECIQLYEELQFERSEPPLRSMSVITDVTTSTTRHVSTSGLTADCG